MVELEELTVAFDSIINTGAPQAVPHHPLQGADYGLAGDVFNLLKYVQSTNATTANEDHIGVVTINTQRKIASIRWCDAAHRLTIFNIQALDVENLKPFLA